MSETSSDMASLGSSSATSVETDPSEVSSGSTDTTGQFEAASEASSVHSSMGSVGSPTLERFFGSPIPVLHPSSSTGPLDGHSVTSSPRREEEMDVDALWDMVEYMVIHGLLELEWPLMPEDLDMPMEPIPAEGPDFDQIDWMGAFEQQGWIAEDPYPQMIPEVPVGGEEDARPVYYPMEPREEMQFEYEPLQELQPAEGPSFAGGVGLDIDPCPLCGSVEPSQVGCPCDLVRFGARGVVPVAELASPTPGPCTVHAALAQLPSGSSAQHAHTPTSPTLLPPGPHPDLACPVCGASRASCGH